jgi:hypothetical protein
VLYPIRVLDLSIVHSRFGRGGSAVWLEEKNKFSRTSMKSREK